MALSELGGFVWRAVAQSVSGRCRVGSKVFEEGRALVRAKLMDGGEWRLGYVVVSAKNGQLLVDTHRDRTLGVVFVQSRW